MIEMFRRAIIRNFENLRTDTLLAILIWRKPIYDKVNEKDYITYIRIKYLLLWNVYKITCENYMNWTPMEGYQHHNFTIQFIGKTKNKDDCKDFVLKSLLEE